MDGDTDTRISTAEYGYDPRRHAHPFIGPADRSKGCGYPIGISHVHDDDSPGHAHLPSYGNACVDIYALPGAPEYDAPDA